MSESLKPKHELILWNLLLTGEEPQISKVKPSMTTAECKPMVDMGLIKLEKRGRASHLVLEDKAWDWMSDRLRSDNFSVQFSKRMTTAIPIFEAFLVRLGQYLRTHDVPLAEFLTGLDSSTNQGSKEHSLEQPKSPRLSITLEARIQRAYADILQSSPDFRVRLAQIHQHLEDVSPQTINDTLQVMQQAGQVSLRPTEDLEEIGPEDEQAAINFGGDDKRYFLYIR